MYMYIYIYAYIFIHIYIDNASAYMCTGCYLSVYIQG